MADYYVNIKEKVRITSLDENKMPMHHTIHCTLPFSQSAELHMGNDHKLSFPCIGKKLLFLQCIQLQDNLPMEEKDKLGICEVTLSVTPASVFNTQSPHPLHTPTSSKLPRIHSQLLIGLTGD